MELGTMAEDLVLLSWRTTQENRRTLKHLEADLDMTLQGIGEAALRAFVEAHGRKWVDLPAKVRRS
jgi:hypothetical protein